jgi:hypothetical protein
MMKSFSRFVNDVVLRITSDTGSFFFSSSRSPKPSSTTSNFVETRSEVSLSLHSEVEEDMGVAPRDDCTLLMAVSYLGQVDVVRELLRQGSAKPTVVEVED